MGSLPRPRTKARQRSRTAGAVRARRHHLHQGHDVHRIEEVEAQEAFGRAQPGSHFVHGQRRGVRSEDHVPGHDFRHLAENPPLERHHLGHGLDHQLRAGDRLIQPGGPREAPGRFVAAAGLHLAQSHTLVQVGFDLGEAPFELSGVHIAQHGFVARHSRHLRDPVAHRSGADDRHLANPVISHLQAPAHDLSPSRPWPRSPGRPRCTSWQVPARRPGGPSRAPASSGCARPSTRPGDPGRWRRHSR